MTKKIMADRKSVTTYVGDDGLWRGHYRGKTKVYFSDIGHEDRANVYTDIAEMLVPNASLRRALVDARLLKHRREGR